MWKSPFRRWSKRGWPEVQKADEATKASGKVGEDPDKNADEGDEADEVDSAFTAETVKFLQELPTHTADPELARGK